MMKTSEIHRLVQDYIGVEDGYLGDLNYKKHREFYPVYCGLDINPDDYQGTTKGRFIKILESSDSFTQAKIVNGIFKKYPVTYFKLEERDYKQTLFDEFQEIINRLESSHSTRQGIEGEFKNLIFAANGPKPEIVLTDLINNKIEIVKNAEYCLVYDQSIPEKGITWEALLEWWSRKNKLSFPNINTENDLIKRLRQSLSSPPEKLLFDTYLNQLRCDFSKNFPALIPQVYLHYDQKTLKELKGNQRLTRQRMDFLILFSNSERVVIEVDGKQHYADGNIASPRKYAEMVAADRKLRLAGYELYRFGGDELQGTNGEILVKQFFIQLLEKHGVIKRS